MVNMLSNAVHQMHSKPRFVPWHCIYLLRMEDLLMDVDSTVCISYWRWSEEQALPSWLAGFTPTVNLLNGSTPWGATSAAHPAQCGRRVLANGAPATGSQPRSRACTTPGTSGWAVRWEASRPRRLTGVLHASRGARSALGAVAGGASRTASTLAGPAATMDPWSETGLDTQDILALGFTYA